MPMATMKKTRYPRTLRNNFVNSSRRTAPPSDTSRAGTLKSPSVMSTEQGTQEIASHECSCDANKNVRNDSITIVHAHDDAGCPADQSPCDDPDNEIEHFLLPGACFMNFLESEAILRSPRSNKITHHGSAGCGWQGPGLIF